MGKLYPIGIQNFEKIRRDGYCYIDKTSKIYELVKTGSYYFLSRPRRFGKSLLISTLEAYFQGKRELFEGLAMQELEKEWKKYPILVTGNQEYIKIGNEATSKIATIVHQKR